jgi:hypothetical protein
MALRIQFRRALAAAWTAANPTLAEGEIALELDTGKFKIGNGTQTWAQLAYSSGPQGPQGIQGIQGIQGEAFGGGSIDTDVNITSTTLSVSTETGALTVAGGAGIGGDLYVGGDVVVNNSPLVYNQDGTLVGIATVTIDSFLKNEYRTAKYIIQVSNESLGEYQGTEIMCVHNGVTSNIVAYDTIFTGSQRLCDFTSVVSGASINLQATCFNANNLIKIQRCYITV